MSRFETYGPLLVALMRLVLDWHTHRGKPADLSGTRNRSSIQEVESAQPETKAFMLGNRDTSG